MDETNPKYVGQGESGGDVIHSHRRQPPRKKYTLLGVVFRKKNDDTPSAIFWVSALTIQSAFENAGIRVLDKDSSDGIDVRLARA
jgi:hypothetical protein